MTEITKRILKLQKERNLNNHQLEIGAELPVSSIQAWTKGKKRKDGTIIETTPSLDSIIKLARYFNVSADYLLCLTEETEQLHKTCSQLSTAKTNSKSNKSTYKIPLIAEPYDIYPSRQLIAFVDILNTKNMCKENSLLFANLLKETFDNFKKQLDLLNVKTTMKIKCFSDNIAVVCNYSEKTAIREISNIITLLSNYQLDLLRHNVTCRGCLTIGQVYIDDTFVIGNGLIEAYLTENKDAIYPRIVISNEIVNIISQHIINGRKTDVYQKDFDGLYFVNYLSNASKEDFEIIDKIFEKEMRNKPNEKVAKIYLWLKNYSNNIQINENISFVDFCEKHKNSTAQLIACNTQVSIDKFAETNMLLREDNNFAEIIRLYSGVIKLEEVDKIQYRSLMLGCIIGMLQTLNVDTKKILGY